MSIKIFRLNLKYLIDTFHLFLLLSFILGLFNIHGILSKICWNLKSPLISCCCILTVKQTNYAPVKADLPRSKHPLYWNINLRSVHPKSITIYPMRGRRGGVLEPIPADTGRGGGVTSAQVALSAVLLHWGIFPCDDVEWRSSTIQKPTALRLDEQQILTIDTMMGYFHSFQTEQCLKSFCLLRQFFPHGSSGLVIICDSTGLCDSLWTHFCANPGQSHSQQCRWWTHFVIYTVNRLLQQSIITSVSTRLIFSLLFSHPLILQQQRCRQPVSRLWGHWRSCHEL